MDASGHDDALPACPILIPLLQRQGHLQTYQLCMCWTCAACVLMLESEFCTHTAIAHLTRLTCLCRVIAIDHAAGDVYLVAMHKASDAASIVAADAWLASTSCAVEEMQRSSASGEGSTPQGCNPQAVAEAEMHSGSEQSANDGTLRASVSAC